jgi:hypothetical protein
VGRHTAADGDSVHPVVAAALARRAAESGGAHRFANTGPTGSSTHHPRTPQTRRIEGDLGWPGPPPAPGGGLGWPGDLPDEPAPGETDRSGASDEEAEDPDPGGRRRGWRRLFGLDRAA